MSHRFSVCWCFFLILALLGSCAGPDSDFNRGLDDDDSTPGPDPGDDDDVGDDDDDTLGAACWTIHIQDGIAESGGAYWVYTDYYDGQGLPLRSVFDFDGDGSDRITDYFWSEKGMIEEVREDSDADGTTDVEWFYYYDGEGNNIETVQATEGVPDWSQSRFWDLESRIVLEEMDFELDQVIDSRRSYEYGGAARSPKEIWDDHDGDGITDLLTSYLYSELGPPIRVEEDEGADGIFERAWTFTLDELGRETMIENDEDGDGEIDLILIVEYDAGGSRSYQLEDMNADGVAEQFWRWHNTYDEKGRRVTSLHDYGDDGIIDGEESWVYECVR